MTQKYVEVSEGEIPVEIHAHNDFGLALANSLVSIDCGASVIHCSVNGLGSRTGNTILEELVIALRMIYKTDLGLNYQKEKILSNKLDYLVRTRSPITIGSLQERTFTVDVVLWVSMTIRLAITLRAIASVDNL